MSETKTRTIEVSKPMMAALKFVRKEKVVRAWPDWIRDGTIRRLRREGYVLATQWVSPPMSPRRGAGPITDCLTTKGRKALRQ